MKEGSQAFYVPGFDADSFLVQLADRLDCFPPDLVSRPFTHLSSTFDLIGTYEHRDPKGRPVDLLGRARSLVGKAIETLEQVAVSIEESQGEVLTEVRARFISGDYEEAVRLAEGVPQPSEELEELLSWSYNDWGVALSERAEGEEGDQAQRLFQAAGEKYAAALEIKPDKYEALDSWGNALLEQGRRALGSEATRLFEEVERLLQQAIQLRPTEVYNLACLRALQGRSEEARALLFDAKKAGTLPSRDHLLNDRDLESVREAAWFEELLDGQ